MELDAMISEICRKVQERVSELEKEEASAEPQGRLQPLVA